MAEEKEPKFVEEKTIIYRGFKDVEEAKRFMDEMRSEMEKTWRSFDKFLGGTRDFIDTIFKAYSVDDEIEYHRRQLKKLEEKKKLMLPAKEEKNEL